MRATDKQKMVIDPRWDGIDFSSDAFHALDQEITNGLNQVVARHQAFAHRHQFEAIANQRGANLSLDNSPVKNGSN